MREERHALFVFGIGCIPVAVGVGLATRDHLRWWGAIGTDPEDPKGAPRR